MKGKTGKTEIRGYVRAIPGLPLARQRQMAADAGCKHVYEYGEAGAGPVGARGRWLQGLRAGDTAWVPSIRCLLRAPAERDKGYSPTADLASITNHVLAIGAILVDAKGRVSSEAPEKWANHVLLEAKRAGQGERPLPALKRNMRKAREAKPVGIVSQWLAPAKASELRLQMAIWTSAGTIAEKRELLHPDLRGLSNKTLYAILDTSGGGKKGGRPRKDEAD